jgi:hypothetical protein
MKRPIDDQHRKAMVELLRAAADLVEDQTINDWKVDQLWDHLLVPDPKTAGQTLRAIWSKMHMVTITLRNVGDLQRATADPEKPAPAAVGFGG